TFEESGIFSGTALNEDGQEQAGMGVAVADYDEDGYFDILKTNFSEDTPNLYHNSRDGSFLDEVYSAGLGVRNQFLGWGALFLDLGKRGAQGYSAGDRAGLPGGGSPARRGEIPPAAPVVLERRYREIQGPFRFRRSGYQHRVVLEGRCLGRSG